MILGGRKKLWEMGLVGGFYLRDDQLPLYYFLHEHKNPFIECARRFGKTTVVLCYVLEKLRQNPGWVARWNEPFRNQCRDIVIPEIDKIQKDCPAHLRFKFRVTDSYFIGPNGSRLYLRGVNDDGGESARGSFAHIIVADEFGSWKKADYVVNEALRPQLLTTDGQFIFMSTPPGDLGHAYYTHKGSAIRDGRYIKRIVTDNKSLTDQKIKDFIDELGGPESTAARRELFCEEVADASTLVVPEYKEELHDLDDSAPRPDFCDKYVGADLGLNDNTALLFSYYDFETQTLVIEDEWVANGKNTREVVEAGRAKELSNWGVGDGGKPFEPFKRVGDNEKQQLFDMATQFSYQMLPTRKDDKLAAINALRVRFQQGKIRIKKRCSSLRFQLKVGLWNDRRSDFIRGEKTGHLDAIAALVYLNRNIDEHHNPFPLNRGVAIHTHHINHEVTAQDRDSRELARALRPFG